MTSFFKMFGAFAVSLFLLNATVHADPQAEGEKKSAPDATAAKDAPAKDKKEEKADKESKPAEETPAPPSHTVKKESFKIQVDLDGVFETPGMTELVLRPKEWPALNVLEAVEHGTAVKKGDVLVKLDMEKIDRAIDDLRAELELGKIGLEQAQEQFSLLEKTAPLDMEAGERAQRIAEEDQKYYLETGRPLALKSQEMQMLFMHESLEYEKQELEQLEKMYKADDLTEETEKIVLKRQRNAVAHAEWSVRAAEIQNEKFLKVELPRQDQQFAENLRRRTLQWSKDRVELPRNFNKAKLELERAKIQNARSEERLAKMIADREAMLVKAPADGIVYYGRCQRGRFNETPAIAEMLRQGGVIQPNQVFMTLVPSGTLFVRASLGEDQLYKLAKGNTGTVSPTGYPDLKWDADVEEIGLVPAMPGVFDLRLSVSPDKPAKQIQPGMSCKIKLAPYAKSDAITVPPKTVFSEPDDENEKFVYLLDKNNKSEKHPVKIGKQNDKQIEIRKGLSEGDKILLDAPKEEK
jgi:multidrug efflux pump subunit AcrA (membrane-fusion protein)